MGDGDYRLVGGSGPTTADLDELAAVDRVLRRAAEQLDSARSALDRGSVACAQRPLGDPAAVSAQRALIAARRLHGHAADDVRDIARRLRQVVRVYDGAESVSTDALRHVIVVCANELGENPLLLAASAVSIVPKVGLVLPVLAETELLSRLLHRAGPLESVGELTADGRAELVMLAAASFLRAVTAGHQLPTLGAVPATAAMLAGALPPAGPTVVVPRDDPPQLPAPRDTADVFRNVLASYDTAGTGTPPGLVSVQQLTHPDGTRTWVVEVPGTEVWGFNQHDPLDMTGNLRLMAGLPDDMTDAVVESMQRAGIRPDEPVMLAGHSQGGMVAMSVAAAVGSAFTIAAVATAGSPDIPHQPPPGVAVRNYRHDEDLVPQTDGSPDRSNADVTVLREDLPGAPGPAAAHELNGYIETASLPVPDDSYSAAVSSVLGPPGTTAVTVQFEATRDPAIVRSVPATISPMP